MHINLLNVEVDYTLMQSNQIELADTMRLLLHQRHPDLFDLLDYGDDTIFLEPSLFYYFSEKSSRPLFIEQLLYGYFSETDRPKQFTGLSDLFGQLYLSPAYNLSTKYITEELKISGLETKNLINNAGLFFDNIQLNQHVPFILYTNNNSIATFEESIFDTIKRYKDSLLTAVNILHNHVTDFWELLQLVTREVSLFNSTNQRSMGSMSHYGTAFINTEGQDHNEVFFIEDLAHQCGHIIFYTLTLHTDEYLKIYKETPLRDITGISYDIRSVYGAVHGLFTYTTILYSLTNALKLGVFTSSQRLEAIARIGFFMNKFEMDLLYMNSPNIFTLKGRHFFDSAFASFEQVNNEFGNLYNDYFYDNQPYIFNYDLFCQDNKIRIKGLNDNVIR